MNSSKYPCKVLHYWKDWEKTLAVTHSIDFSSFGAPRCIWLHEYITFNAFFITEPNARVTYRNT